MSTETVSTIDMGPFDVPLAVLLWLGIALLVAAAVLAGVMGYHLATRRTRPGQAPDRAVVNECLGTDLTVERPPEPPVGSRVVTHEGHVWVRREGIWESEDAPHVASTWPVLAGIGARLVEQPKLSPVAAMAKAKAAAHVELDDFLADPEGYAGAES